MSDSRKSRHIAIDARAQNSSTGRYVYRLVEHLQKIDTVNCYSIMVMKDDPWQPTNPNFRRVVMNFPQFSVNPINELWFALKLYKLNAELVHFSMTQFPVLYFPSRWRVLGIGSKIAVTTHDLTMLHYTRPGRFPRWFHALRMVLYRFLMWLNHHKARVIFVPTKFVKNDLAAYQSFTRHKIVVTLEACDPPKKIKAKKLSAAKKPYILHIGSPFPHKNIERLVEAFTLVKKELPDLQLILGGKKEHYFEQLELSIADHPHRDDILIPGFVTDEEMKWLQTNAEAYVLPALSEGFGIPGLEAMSNGTPVVSTNATCSPEVNGDAAYYFNPRDIDDMADAIVTVLKDKKLQKQMIAKGHKQWKKFSWERMAKETLEVYEKTV